MRFRRHQDRLTAEVPCPSTHDGFARVFSEFMHESLKHYLREVAFPAANFSMRNRVFANEHDALGNSANLQRTLIQTVTYECPSLSASTVIYELVLTPTGKKTGWKGWLHDRTHKGETVAA